MKEQRKKIITNEIEYWRRSNLLPSHYCDFLLNLYTEGEAANNKEGKDTRNETGAANEALPPFSIPQFEWKWGGIAVFMIVMLYLAFHFTDFTLTMQMTLIGFLTLLFYILGFIKRKSNLSSHLFLGLASMLLVLGGVYGMELYGYTGSAVIIYLACACLIWYVTGIWAKKRYLSFCALLSLQGIYGWITYHKSYEHFSWWQMEAYWLPIAIVLIVLGLVWKRRQQQTSATLFFCGIVALFGGELAGLFIPEADQDWLLYLLYLKIFTASFLLLSLKNFWWVWFSAQRPLR
ncbi:hypothetical protein [Aneurinibacillus sp. REN35]|uniref:hypothetical protein n=1 Tax=Aneurinibacillus sp. REN35 TaxID=3237286 RepID=UPI003527C1BD